jgi:5'-nucleotidase/UDP-sugar diphosphatase
MARTWSYAFAIAVSAAACGDDGGAVDPATITLGDVTTTLDTFWYTVRAREALAGDLAADAVREALPTADVVLINGGTLRFDETARPDGIYPPGTWTEATLQELLRFDFLPTDPNRMVLVTVTGAQLESVLERSVSSMVDVSPGMGQDEQARGWFLQVSGARYRADLAQQAQVVSDNLDAILIEGHRIVEASVHGAPLDPAASYRLAVTNFTADGKDGHVALRSATARTDANTSSADSLRTYLRAHTPVTPALDGRIVIERSGI